ncbi:MAG: ABC transporter permease [Dehalococcoidia bacterium]|nr:ABC transporter permease [Dehalococcoidia bacterium]
MFAYLLRRLAFFVPTALMVVTAVFLLIRLIPGDTVDLMVQDNGYAASADAMRERLGIDKPIHVQYVTWLGELARGDFGTSLHTGRTASQELKARGPVSLELGLMSLTISLLIAIPVGVISASKSGSLVDYGMRSFAIGMLAIPNFWFGTMVIVIPSVLWNVSVAGKWVPLFDDPVSNLKLMIFPALIGGAAASASVMRMTRTMVLEVNRQDYIRTARAKGLASGVIVWRHTLKNALIPVVTLVGLQVPVIISGSVIMEQVFGLPGMGRFLLDNISQRDYPMVQAMTLLFVFVVLTVNLLVDLLYPVLDPRISLRS